MSAQAALDSAVYSVYGFKSNADPLEALLALNQEVASREADGESILAPGLPPCVKSSAEFITDDAVRMLD